MSETPIDLRAELAKLPARLTDGPVLAPWADVESALVRLAREQFKANQEAGHAIEELSQQLAECRKANEDWVRVRNSLQEDAWQVRLRIIEFLDRLDDLMVVARQREDAFWSARVERLVARAVDLTSALGLAAVPGVGSLVDGECHEVIGSTGVQDASGFVVAEVSSRGFRFEGSVIRRAQVITSA